MTILQAVILGVIQGATEFIPVSSTGHLVLVPWLLGFDSGGLTFDLAAHVGTLAALIWYFWNEWVTVLSSMCRCMLNGGRCNEQTRMRARIGVWIIVGCIPAGVAGVLFGDFVDQHLRSPLLIAFTTALFGLVMLAADRMGRRERTWTAAGLKDWFGVGCAQAVALIPGVSRSGITMSAGLAMGLERDAAARVSFLLSAPTIGGAAAVHILHVLHGQGLPPSEIKLFLVASLSAAVVGYLCIRFLLGYLREHGFAPFVWYRLALSVLIVALYAMRGGR